MINGDLYCSYYLKSKMYSQDFPFMQNIASFSCKVSESVSYLKSGYFQKFMNSDLNAINGSKVVKLFGKLYPINCCTWTNMQQLFMDIKRNFFLVKKIAIEDTNCSKKESSIDPANLRMDILQVFHMFLVSLQKIKANHLNTTLMPYNSVESVENNLQIPIIQLLKEVKSLLLFTGRVSSLPIIKNIGGLCSDSSKSALSFYHLCLDIWYNCLAILYSVDRLMPVNFDETFCDFIDQTSPFLQLSFLMIHEFSVLAINHCKSSARSSNSPFLCSCIREFWIMLINMIDKSNSYLEKSSFWNIFLSNIQLISKNMSSKFLNEELSVDTFSPLNIHSDINPIEVFLWLTSHIAPLYKYNALGCEDDDIRSGSVVAKYLVHNLLSSTTKNEEKILRNILSHCIQLVKLWEPSGDVLLPLTDFYIKKIDETFSIPGIDLSYLFKDSLSWFTYINNISDFVTSGKGSSFDRFLYILSILLKPDADHNLWRSLKGRIYSKFIPKKIKEMSEVGLQNSFSLFHVILMSGKLEVIDKVCEFATVIETLANFRKQIISWKALYVVLYVCHEKKCDSEKVVTILSKFFNSTCSDYAKIKGIDVHKSNLMKLLLVYVDNMFELYKRNDLNINWYQLICTGFRELLPACGFTEGNYILNSILTILQRIQKIIESNREEFVENESEYIRVLQLIFDNIYPFIEKISVTDTAPLAVPHIAATLTKLACDLSSLWESQGFSNLNFIQIFMYFTCNEMVNSDIICQYLCFILDYLIVIDNIKLKVPNMDVVIFQSWLKCIIYVHTGSKCIEDLTKKVLQSTTITEILPDVNTLNFQTGDHINLSISFFSLIATTFNKCDLQQKTKIARKIQQYFKTYALLAVNKMKKFKDKHSFSHVYKLTSHLVDCCAPVLHFHVTPEHILLQILDQIIYPQILFSQDKALQSLVSCSIKEYLPLFIKGLFKLDYRNEKPIEREIRNTFIYYISVFPAASNPLTKLIVDSFLRKPDSLTVDACNFVLEALKKSLLLKSVEKPISVFEFYYQVFIRLTPPACKEISNVLLKCAMDIYVRQNDSLTIYLEKLIKKVLIFFKKEMQKENEMQLSHSKVILIPIIEWFVLEKLQWAIKRGYSLLEIFVEFLPQIILDMIPIFTRSIETLEKKKRCRR